MFVAGTAEWSVRSLEDDPQIVYLVWEHRTDKLVGVASNQDGLKDLFADLVSDLKAGKPTPTRLAVLGVKRTKRGGTRTQNFVGTITKVDGVDGEHDIDVSVQRVK